MTTVIRGTCPHGRILFAAVNEPAIIKDFAGKIAEMVSVGCTIELVEAPVKLGGSCGHCASRKD